MSIKRTIITTATIVVAVAMVASVVGAQTPTVAQLMQEIAALQAQLQSLSGTPAATTSGTAPAVCAGVTFTRNLTVGSTGSDVQCLQAILNMSASTQVATTGAGSPGHETTTFGPKTLAAVRLYQAANGLTPANQVGPLTRAKLTAVLGGTAAVTPGTPVVTPVGSISATLASDSPASGALINSEASADLLNINFSGTGTVTSITLQRSGISNQSTLANIYLYDGNTRLTDGYSFNINGQLVMNGLSIAVNGTHEIAVKADVSSTATADSSSIAVTLTGYTGNSSTMTANVMGSTMSIVTGTAATATLSNNSVAATSLPGINAGTTQYTFWSAPIQINTRAVLLKTANFRMIGSAPSDSLSNIKLFVDGVDTGKAATVAPINGSTYLSFDMTSAPITLTTGSHTIDVRADIQKGTDRDITLSLQQAADLTITDPQVGVNIAVSGTPNSAGDINIATGSVTTTVDPTFTSQTDISGGATNAVIGRFIVHSYGEDVKVSTLVVTPEVNNGTVSASASTACTTGAGGLLTGGTCGLNNVTVYFNGSQIGSQKAAWDPTAGSLSPITFQLGSQMIVPAGQDSTLEIRADMQTTANIAYTGGTVLVTLPLGVANATGQSSQSTVVVPAAAVATSGLNISTSTVVSGTNPQLLAQSIAPNSTGVKVGSYVIQNQSTSESVRLTSLTVGLVAKTTNGVDANGLLNGGTAVALTNFSALRTSDTTGNGSTPVQPTASNAFSVNDTLAPGASMVVDVFANTGASAGYVQTTLVVQSIGSVDNLSATYPLTTATPAYKVGQVMTLSTGTIAAPAAALTSSSATTPQQYVVPQGSTTPESQATFEFISTGGASNINELDFAAPSTVTQICVGSVCATPFGGTAKLTGLSLNVPTGAGLDQVVTVAYGPVGVGGNVSNTASSIELTYVKYTAGGAAQTPLAPTASAPYVYLVNTMPTVTTSGTATGLTITGAVQKIGDVMVKATGNGSIKLDKMTFNVGYSGFDSGTTPTIGATSLFLSAGSGSSTPITTMPCSMLSTTITCTDSSSYTNGYPIGTGATQEFSLYASVTGTSTSSTADPTLTTALKADTTASTSGATGTTYFQWDDTSMNGTAADGTTTTYGSTYQNGTGLNSYNIYNFPTSTNYTVSVK